MKLIQEINCRIEELTPEHQIMIVRLINSLASHGYDYQKKVIQGIKEVEKKELELWRERQNNSYTFGDFNPSVSARNYTGRGGHETWGTQR